MNAMLETPELPAVFDGVKLAAVAAVLYVIVRCLNLKSPTAPPELYFQDSALSRFLLKSCPLLTKEYIPPLIWGKSGHIQTALYGKMGRVRSPHPYGQRKFITMADGATSTFDLFEPLAEHCVGDDVTMVICPGIANHSEKQYIRTFVDYAQKNGYRCAVLNHLGALPNIELTSPRMFTYGCTWEFGAMVNYIKKTYPLTQLVVVGFSLGGNIVCKYLGETQANQERVLCCVSVCQGYSALRAQETFMQWDHCRRFYNFLMADNMKKIILSHRQALFGDRVKKPRCLEDTDLSRLYTATSLMQIDDNVMRKFHGYNSLKEYYEEESCMRYLHRIYVPLMLVNAADDPLVHESLLAIPKSLSGKRENVMFVLPLHGGHLGFFEGSVLFPEPLTWMDKLVVEYANAICQWERNKSQCSDTEQVEADLE
ncbi:monoacylglycerol lipase ABHD2 isoform 1-T4 [Trichechus inunguis]|uniref:Monoacylglycerol lipase ABHD2 n=1 Tax=Trichechus manatus latirostris TaxID=127582 RepID=A0A2Y9QJR9_TRIMA|nr:monoacylglycerol lipase ABHD2 isoform X1 [Trichechus manatus latirostris]XP_023581702.1 monoacylglycerol lipase ABHD2 isoform X1 [Trichechus manatus latirostris]XP_023581703.1 monoacylglycerol lipase ABHD2 isoform X1 [Trichechus manatus latirostris]